MCATLHHGGHHKQHQQRKCHDGGMPSMQSDGAMAAGPSTSRSAPPGIASEACDLQSGQSTTAELEEGEIVDSPSPRSAVCAEDMTSSLRGHESLSQAGFMVTENLDTQNCLAPIDQELRGHLKSNTARYAHYIFQVPAC
jgi:hypothetical protein